MAAFGTKKPNGDRGIALTYPAVFTEVYDLPLAYFPSDEGAAPSLPVGRDFQANYHERKKSDAVKVVMDGLQARKSSERLMMTGPHNYHLPRPVLSQRRYANPAGGVVGFSSARRDGSVAAPFTTTERQMEGGVLSSFEGQQYYRNKLAERSSQLDRINILATGTPVPRESVMQLYDSKKLGPKDKVEFFVSLRNFTDAVLTGDISRFTMEDFKELLGYLFRFAPFASAEEIGGVMRALDNIFQMLHDYTDDVEPDERVLVQGTAEERSADEAAKQLAYAQTLTVYVEMLQNYLRQMAGFVGRNTQDRIALSSNLIQSLGFNNAMIFDDERDALDVLSRQNVRAAQRREDIDGYWDDDDGDGDEDDDDRLGDGMFSYRALTREDAEQPGVGRAPFAGRSGDANREAYGARNGLYSSGAAAAFFGEGEDGEAGDMVAPLGLAGADPAATQSRTDPLSLKQAVDSAIESAIQSLPGYKMNMTPDELEEFVRRSYPETDVFANEIAAALADGGNTPAQIAKGMELTGLPFFADYIAENTGEIDPLPAAPAYNWANRFSLMGGPPESGAREETETGEAMGLGGDSPTEEEREQWFAATGIPRTRDEFLRTFRDIRSLSDVASRMGIGGFMPAYRPRLSSNPKNIREEMIKRIKARIDPRY
jgi:hypothetical protein